MKKIILTTATLICGVLYSNSQNLQWVNNMGGIENDVGKGVVIGKSNHIYLTGWFGDTVDFNPSQDTANSTSLGNNDIFLVKYDSLGQYIWSISAGSASISYGGDLSNSIAIDDSENVYLTGHFIDSVDFDPGQDTAYLKSNGASDIFIVKYDSSGDYEWAKSIGGPYLDQGTSIITDKFENVYISGYFGDTVDFNPGQDTSYLYSPSNYNIFFTKYDQSGNYKFAKSIKGKYSGNAPSISTDDLGSIYIAGEFEDTADFDPSFDTALLVSVGGKDIFFAKYDSSGNLLWAKSIGSNSLDRANSIFIDGTGNTYISGRIGDVADFDPGSNTSNLYPFGGGDIFIAKYDSSGNYVWAKNIGAAFMDESFNITVDSLGNLYACGWFSGIVDFNPSIDTFYLTSFGLNDIFFAKYNPLGDLIWAKNIGSMNTDRGNYITLDNDLNIYLTGYFEGSDFNPGDDSLLLTSNGSADIFIAKYDNKLCYEPLNIIVSICQGDSILLAGTYQTTPGIYYDISTTGNGCDSITSTTLTVNSLPTVSLSGLDTSYCSTDAAVTITGLPGGGTFSGTGGLTGNQFYPATGVNTYTVTYSYTDSISCYNSVSQSVNVVQCTGISEEHRKTQIKIYPNPNAGKFNIEINIKQIESFKLKIFNNLGQEIFTEKIDHFKGIYVKQFDLNVYPIGVYNLQLVTDKEVMTRQIIIK